MRKVFCIGANKTGTTSLLEFFRQHGFTCGDQAEGEALFAKCYAKGAWEEITRFAESCEFYQDLPFSAAQTYRALDAAFPQAKFILTLRRSAEQWHESLVRFHAVKFGDGINPPSRTQLEKATYRYKGFMWDANRALYNSPADDPYHKESLLSWYNKHNQDVISHFSTKYQTKERASKLLQIEIEDPLAAKKIAEFVGFDLRLPILPHLNRFPE